METYRQGKIVDTEFFLTDNTGTEKIVIKGSHQWRLEAEYFADRILKGEGIDVPAENGVANLRVMDAVCRSTRCGQTIVL